MLHYQHKNLGLGIVKHQLFTVKHLMQGDQYVIMSLVVYPNYFKRTSLNDAILKKCYQNC